MNIIKKYYIKKFIKNIDNTIKIKFGKNLQCDIDNHTVYISDTTDKIDIMTFKQLVQEINPKCNFNTLLIGILHEIGHIYTYDERDEEQYNRDNQLLSMLYKAKKINAIDFNNFYIRLPLEQKATEWAIQFAMQNKKFCRYFQNKIGNEKIK